MLFVGIQAEVRDISRAWTMNSLLNFILWNFILRSVCEYVKWGWVMGTFVVGEFRKSICKERGKISFYV